MMPFLFSTTSTHRWRDCPRSFYYAEVWGGTGIQRTGVSEDLLYGSAVHDLTPALWDGDAAGIPAAVAALRAALTDDPAWRSDLTAEARTVIAAEWGRLLTGHLHGLVRTLFPYLKARYQALVAEGDVAYWLSDSEALLAKPDLLLAALPEVFGALDGVGYLEYKTVKAPSTAWHAQWKRNPQAWAGALATRADRGLDIQWFQVLGLVKGTTDEYRHSPFCWAYWRDPSVTVRESGAAPLDRVVTTEAGEQWRPTYTNRKGWVRRSTDEFPGGVEAWVLALDADTINEQFVLTEPEGIDYALAEEWLATGGRADMRAAMQRLRLNDIDPADPLGMFPRELSECESGFYGKGCGFCVTKGGPCGNPAVDADPLSGGVFKRRVPHHQIEIDIRRQHANDGQTEG